MMVSLHCRERTVKKGLKENVYDGQSRRSERTVGQGIKRVFMMVSRDGRETTVKRGR